MLDNPTLNLFIVYPAFVHDRPAVQSFYGGTVAAAIACVSEDPKAIVSKVRTIQGLAVGLLPGGIAIATFDRGAL